MSPFSRLWPTAGLLLLGGLASLALISRSGEAAQSAAPATAPTSPPAPYYYGGGAQGYGYYVTPQLRNATATAPVQVAARRPQTVGPGARNWATGNRVPLHRPWLNSRR